MSIRIEYLGEPKLQFAQYFEHEDSKTGLAEFGPFGRNVPGLHRSEIMLGFVGTRETVSGAKEWIAECGSPIESTNIKTKRRQPVSAEAALFDELPEDVEPNAWIEKGIDRDFVGFSLDSPFACCFQTNERWDRYIHGRDLTSVLGIEDKATRIRSLVDLVEGELSSLATTGPCPDIIILALTQQMADEAHSVHVQGSFHLNFRRAIKARVMKLRVPIPIQIIRRRTITGERGLQDKATRAWNFCTAQYYKADGVPWRPTTLDPHTLYIGVSFYVAQDDDTLTMRSSVAQAFDYLGQGLVLRGEPFPWDADKHGRTPHLTRAAARNLIKATLKEYDRISETSPNRVVVHKSSEYWGREHGEYDELEGFCEGISDVFPKSDVDLLALRQTGVYLLREGNYPALRGTYSSIDDTQHFLYTMGFIPYLETYPGSYVPSPWQITDHHGSSAPKELLREVLALTKMNVNNCAFADGVPITLSFAKRIGEIMRHIPEGDTVQSHYKFYM